MSSRAGEHVRRFAQSLLGGMIATAGAAAYETTLARAAAGPSAASFAPVFSIILGLLAPLGLVVAGVTACAFAFATPEHPPSFSHWLGKLRGFGAWRKADLAAFVPLIVIAAFVWMTVCAHLARTILSLPITAGLAGIATTGAALASGFGLAILTLAAVPALRRMLARRSAKRPLFVDPVVTGAMALALVIALFAIGVRTGSVSGEGNVLGIYGIFKRPELDLRAPAELLAMALGATIGPSFARPPRTPSRSMLLLFTIFAVAPLALFVRDARAMNREIAITQAIERGAPLANVVLKPARRFTDRDHDGYSGLFGGGDCDDTNPDIHPGGAFGKDCLEIELKSDDIEALAPVPVAQKVDASLFPEDMNVVFITVDTLRADLGYAGYPKHITPNIDALAARSTVFDRGYSLASFTGRSVGPLMIGKYASETNRNWGHFNKFNEKDTFISERFHAAGYRTMSIQAHRYFDVWGGFERGFDVLDMTAAPPKDAPMDVSSTVTSDTLTNVALSLLAKDENTKGRFFLWVHYLDPHADYLRHEGFDFGNDSRGLYDGEIAFTDMHIGRLLDAIAKAGYAGRTAIVLTSDHGEAFGEHGMWNHGRELWEPLIHVPLIIYVPGGKPHHVAVRRSAIDIVPTLLDLARIPQPVPADDASTDFLSGTSLLSDVFPAADAVPVQRDIFVDMAAGPYNDERRALIHDDLKLYISNGSRFDLYDLAHDPEESTNIAESDGAKFKDMMNRYAAKKSRLREIKVTGPRKG